MPDTPVTLVPCCIQAPKQVLSTKNNADCTIALLTGPVKVAEGGGGSGKSLAGLIWVLSSLSFGSGCKCAISPVPGQVELQGFLWLGEGYYLSGIAVKPKCRCRFHKIFSSNKAENMSIALECSRDGGCMSGSRPFRAGANL